MNTLTKLVLGAMGRERPAPALGDARTIVQLPAHARTGGMPIMQAFAERRSEREFTKQPLPLDTLSALMWAADGINRDDGGRTAPSALNAQEIDIYVALPDGAYRYEATSHALSLMTHVDLRRITGYQDFVDEAPLDLVYVAHYQRLSRLAVDQRQQYAYAAAGAISQNVYLFCAAHGLGTVLRAWIDRAALADALGLSHDEQVLLSQTVGYVGRRTH